MTNRDLLKEAIADAKAIKDTAIANAKAALEESFTPHLKSMLAAKINEMDSFYEEDDTLEEVNDELDEMKKAEEVEEAKEENDLDEIDLDELLAELDSEEPVTEGEEKEEVEEAKKEEVEEAKKDEEKEESEEEEIDLENMSEEDLKNFIENVIEDMIADGEIEAGHEGMEDEEEVEMDDETEMDSEEEINIDEILAELKGEEDEVKEGMSQEMGASAGAGLAELAKMFKSGLISLNDFLEKIAAASAPGFSKGMREEEMKDELEEAYAAVKTLQSELNEINVLNAKLLYTNKIFKAKNLTESEKVKVLTAFDKATSKKEAQLVYETLVEGLKNKPKAPIKENLGRASKPAGMAPKTQILESNDMIARFQKLAGII